MSLSPKIYQNLQEIRKEKFFLILLRTYISEDVLVCFPSFWKMSAGCWESGVLRRECLPQLLTKQEAILYGTISTIRVLIYIILLLIVS